MTGSTDDTAVFTVGTNGTLSIVTTDTAAAAANIEITADGTVDINSAGLLTLDSGAAINIEPAEGSAILLDGTISIDAGVVTGATSITSTVFVGNVTGNASGTAATVTSGTQASITTVANVVEVGALDAGSITANFGAIDNGTSGIRTNTFTAETSVVADANGGADLGTTSVGWGDVYIADDKKIQFGDGQDATIEYDENGTDTLSIAGSAVTFEKGIYQEPETQTATGSITINCGNGNYHELTLGDGNVSGFAFTEVVKGQRIILRVKQHTAHRDLDSNDGWDSITVNGASKTAIWPGGTVPTLTEANNAIDVYGILFAEDLVPQCFVIGQNLS